jgi:hypothetical protein
MGAYSFEENTPNAPEFICPTVFSSPKVLDSMKKDFIGP